MSLDTIPSFEELVILAKEDPKEFEALRAHLCDQILSQAPEHIARRLQGLQFKIDMERRRSKTAMASCLKLSSMMNDSLIELKEVLSNPEEFLRAHQASIQITNKKRSSAEIIPLFPQNQKIESS